MEVFFHFPTTALGWVLNIVFGGIGAVLLMSFVEIILHGYFMHTRFLPAWVYRRVPYLERAVLEHNDLHHTKYYVQFDREDDPYGKNLNLKIHPPIVLVGIIGVAPIYAYVATLSSSVPYIVFILVVTLHMFAWNLIHTEMHQPRHPWWSKTGTFKFLARYHYLHHHHIRNHGGKNFNVVVPFWDFVLGSSSTHVEGTELELDRLGYLA
ncbi:MAG: hypothetical protein AAB955_03090 [Patescibacteria group bacterium]